MRWERLFAEIEAGFDDEADRERDMLADDLASEQWASTTWPAFLAGQVTLEVEGLGRVEGEVQLANSDVVVLDDLAIASSAVLSVLDPARGSVAVSPGTRSLGWRHVMRTLADIGGPLRLHRRDGSTVDGIVDAVGGDFVRLRGPSGSNRLVPFGAIVAARDLG